MQAEHESPGLNFTQLDVAAGADFTQRHASSFSLVTSFSCLHWVPDQPAAVTLFNRSRPRPTAVLLYPTSSAHSTAILCADRVLRPAGRFLFVIAGTHNPATNLLRREYERMRSEAAWAEALKPTRFVLLISGFRQQNIDL